MPDKLLRIKDLHTHFFTPEGIVKAVDGVSFDITRGQSLGVLGESGCGKSVTALSIMRLIPDPPMPIALALGHAFSSSAGPIRPAQAVFAPEAPSRGVPCPCNPRRRLGAVRDGC